jgi:hypothetical protein
MRIPAVVVVGCVARIDLNGLGAISNGQFDAVKREVSAAPFAECFGEMWINCYCFGVVNYCARRIPANVFRATPIEIGNRNLPSRVRHDVDYATTGNKRLVKIRARAVPHNMSVG